MFLLLFCQFAARTHQPSFCKNHLTHLVADAARFHFAASPETTGRCFSSAFPGRRGDEKNGMNEGPF